jgi:acylphosphatase
MTEPVDCRRIIFEGRVQGVGFRFTAVSIASQCSVRGYVRNLPDGSVELVAQASAGDLERMLKRLAEAFEGYIERETSEDIACHEPLAGFEIRR